MSHRFRIMLICALAASACGGTSPAPFQAPPAARAVAKTTSYDALVKVYQDLRASQQPTVTDGVPDYTVAAVQSRRQRLDELGTALDGVDSSGWPIPQKVDHLLALALWRDYDFQHRVMRAWARDPGFYTSQVESVPLTQLPVIGEELTRLEIRLAAVPRLLDQARANLTEGASEQTLYTIRGLEQADGVGHGYPYRAAPPAGTIGWFDDMIVQGHEKQAALVPAIERARAATVAFRDWLKENQPKMNGKWGVGMDNYTYYQRYVRLMPYDARMNLELADRELERGRAFLAVERWKNRKLPTLEPSPTAAEYERRKQDADAQIRQFIREQDLLTIPEYIKELDTNVPWIVRPGGPNFWEAIQFRDPRPDHVHAVIPGHRFDGIVRSKNTHPVRGTYSDGGRSEGWAFYLEEMFLQAGLLDRRPRTKELFYLFQVKRASRNKAEVLMHDNQYTVADAVKWMRSNVQFLDEDVARVDAEIYLRRLSYGSGYQMGKLQMDQLLSDRSHQLKDAFNLREFHDEFLSKGTIPISLIRYEMTSFDDQIRDFWTRVPAPPAAPAR